MAPILVRMDSRGNSGKSVKLKFDKFTPRYFFSPPPVIHSFQLIYFSGTVSREVIMVMKTLICLLALGLGSSALAQEEGFGGRRAFFRAEKNARNFELGV